VRRRTIRRTDYLYAGFNDPPQKITGDSYRTLFSIGGRTYSFAGVVFESRIKVSECTVNNVFAFIKGQRNKHEPMTLQYMADNIKINKTTLAKSIRFLENKNLIKVERNSKNKSKGWVYRSIV